jgi:UPF0288 family protein (methanogenesis marker protein 3)
MPVMMRSLSLGERFVVAGESFRRGEAVPDNIAWFKAVPVSGGTVQRFPGSMTVEREREPPKFLISQDDLREFLDLKADIKSKEARADKLRDRIIEAIRDAGYKAIEHGPLNASLTTSNRVNVPWKKLLEENGFSEIAADFEARTKPTIIESLSVR